MRCATLAGELVARGAEVWFVSRVLPGDYCDWLERMGFRVRRLTGDVPDIDRDAHQTRVAVDGIGDLDWFVVDHYALDAGWESRMRVVASRILVIDDLADRPHDADILLDQNLHRDFVTRYDNLIPTHAQRLLGPRYALLRPEFQAARAKRQNRNGTVRRLLIFFGGTDPTGETAKALLAVKAAHSSSIDLDVIVGPANPNLDNIRKLCTDLPRAHVHYNPGNIAELMSNADLAVGAAGATSWERCCLGLPSIVIALAMNQESVAKALADNGLAIYLGTSETATVDVVAATIAELMGKPERIQAMGRACAGVADGKGLQRVTRALDAHPIVLRPAQIWDCEPLHQWRNAEETRRYSHQSAPIPMKQHQRWFDAVLHDPQRALLIGERDRRPVGVLRYDCEESRCTVSVYLVPGQHGRGYGARLLQAGHDWLQRHRKDIKLVRAEVLDTNSASLNAFLQAGYQRHGGVYIKNLD